MPCAVKRSIADFHRKHNPFRPPIWRYMRVLARQRDGKRVPDARSADQYIRAGLRFLKAWEAITDATDNASLADRRLHLFPHYPGMYCAYEIFQHPDERVRHGIEARILARQTDDEIAHEACVLPEAVEWYEAMFFNVRDRLDNRDYISRQVLGGTAAAGLMEMAGLACKFFAYFAGPVVLDAVMHAYDQATRTPNKGQKTNNFFDDHFGTHARRCAAEKVTHFQPNSYNIIQLFELHMHLMEQARLAQQEGVQANNLESNLTKMLEAVQWCVGSDQQQVLAGSAIAGYVGQTRELRVDEQYALSRGETPATLNSIPPDFPQPPKVIDAKVE